MMTGGDYFCACFICGSEALCEHRESDLVVWWRTITATVPRPEKREVKVIVLDRRPEPVKTPDPPAKPEPRRKPLVRVKIPLPVVPQPTDHFRSGSRYARDYSEARGW